MMGRIYFLIMPLIVALLVGEAQAQDYFQCNGTAEIEDQNLTVVIWGYRVTNRELSEVKVKFFLQHKVVQELADEAIPAKDHFFSTNPRLLRRNSFSVESENQPALQLYLPKTMPTEKAEFPGDLGIPAILLKKDGLLLGKGDTDTQRIGLTCQFR